MDRFDDIANSVWDDFKKLIPLPFQESIQKIQFWLLDEPTPDLLVGLPREAADNPEELCGLHEGAPLMLASEAVTDFKPVRVYLFRWAHMDFLWPDDENPEAVLRQELATTLVHEIGHYYGLSEKDLLRFHEL